jgi:hypothetical protein
MPDLGCTCQPNPYLVTGSYLLFQIWVRISNFITIYSLKLWKPISKSFKPFRAIQHAEHLPPPQLTDANGLKHF